MAEDKPECDHYWKFDKDTSKLHCSCGAEQEIDERCKDGRHCFCANGTCCWCGQYSGHYPIMDRYEPITEPSCSTCKKHQTPSTEWPCDHCKRNVNTTEVRR